MNARYEPRRTEERHTRGVLIVHQRKLVSTNSKRWNEEADEDAMVEDVADESKDNVEARKDGQARCG